MAVTYNCEKVIDVKDELTLYIYNTKEFDLTINLEDNAKVSVYYFNEASINNKMVVNQNNNSEFNLYHTFNIDGEYNFMYRANMNGNKSVNNIYISGVTRGQANLDIDGEVNKDTKDNELNENVKVLTIDGKTYVSPKIEVDCLDVIANHNTTISNIREDELFYLNSKGINKDSAIKLLTDGYIYGMIKNNEEFLNLIRR